MLPGPESEPRPGGWKRALRDKQGPDLHTADTLRGLGAWWVPALAVVVGLALVGLHDVRSGVLALAVGAGAGALARAMLPERLAGGLVARSRWVDVGMWLLAALVLGAMSQLIRL